MSFDWNNLAQFKLAGRFLDGQPDDVRVFLSPYDKIHDLLAELLKSAQHSLVLNMYGYDDAELDAIIQAKARRPGFFLQMSLDSSQAGGKAEAEILSQWGHGLAGKSIAIGQSIKHRISHLKVCLVDGVYSVTGSTNWSLAGEQLQDNELTLSRNATRAAELRSALDLNHAEMIRQMHAKALKAPPAKAVKHRKAKG